MEQTLQHVAEEDARAKRDAHRFDSLHDSANDVWGRLEAVRPDEVHEVQHRVFAPEPGDAKREMLHDRAGRLAMDEIAVRQRVLEHRHDRVDVVR